MKEENTTSKSKTCVKPINQKWNYRLIPRVVLIIYAYFTRDAYLWAKSLGTNMTNEQGLLIMAIIAGAVWLMKEYHTHGIQRRKIHDDI